MMEDLQGEWERCAPWIEAALHRGGDCTTIEEVRQAVLDGLMQFWPAADAAVVTQIIKGAARKEFNLYLAGGSLERLRDMVPSLEQFARECECELITLTGRLGWQRTFLTREMGYRPVAVLLGKVL